MEKRLKMKKASFIVCEGMDGSGKTTVSKYLLELMGLFGYDVKWTREPGGTPLAESIRNLILTTEMDSTTELLLFNAARRDHVENLIKPSLAKDITVVSDRFVDSTIAYQCYANQRSPLHQVLSLHQTCIDFDPDYVIYLDILPEVAAARANQRGAGDRFDNMPADYKKRLEMGYQVGMLMHKASTSTEVVTIDANQNLLDVFEQVFNWFVRYYCATHQPAASFVFDNEKHTKALENPVLQAALEQHRQHWRLNFS
jgi:dTMP kinase